MARCGRRCRSRCVCPTLGPPRCPPPFADRLTRVPRVPGHVYAQYKIGAALIDGDFALARDVCLGTPVGLINSADDVGAGLLGAAVIRDVEGVRRFHEFISAVGEGRTLAGLDTFEYAFEAAIEGDDEKAGRLYRKADAIWVEVGTPVALALARATMAQLLGRDSEPGRQAATQAFAFLDGAGMKGYIDLLPEVFASLTGAEEELAG